ncbi:MAG TPA: response regulator transcription factor [Epsilonproteobacteria bacterium]|nr:response regulator transcription factor [Campylobacterota bacterium]HHD78662.1 response regulator transcription factor [Campylobacterota bacterium]
MQSLANILIIEDDTDILELETFHLLREGYNVMGVTSTHEVEMLLKEENIDLMLVDRMLPKVEGSEFVAFLRDKGIDTPVMFISAKDKDEDIEEGFLRGCDDYLRKPFNMNELLFRVKALLRRTTTVEFERITARDIVMDLNTRKVYVEEKEVKLTKLEFNLLAFLITHKNKVLEREHIMKNIWKDQIDIQKRTVNVTIKRLKEKIDFENTKDYIVPIRGIGYRFNAL